TPETFSAGTAWVTVSSAEPASGSAGAAVAAPAPVAAKAAPRAATPRVLAADCFMKMCPRMGYGDVSGAVTVNTAYRPPQTAKCGRIVNTARIPRVRTLPRQPVPPTEPLVEAACRNSHSDFSPAYPGLMTSLIMASRSSKGMKADFIALTENHWRS